MRVSDPTLTIGSHQVPVMQTNAHIILQLPNRNSPSRNLRGFINLRGKNQKLTISCFSLNYKNAYDIKSEFDKKRTGEVGGGGNTTPFGNTTARFWPKPLSLGLNGRHQILLLFILIDQQISKKRGSTLSGVLQA